MWLLRWREGARYVQNKQKYHCMSCKIGMATETVLYGDGYCGILGKRLSNEKPRCVFEVLKLD